MQKINSIVSNLADVVERIINGMGEFIRVSGEITSQMVREQGTTGLAYVILGTILTAACICLFLQVLKNKYDNEIDLIIRLIFSIILGIAGFALVAVNIRNWLSPTKTIAFEIIDKIL